MGPVPVWLIALVVAVLAPPSVQAFAQLIERRARRRTLEALEQAKRSVPPSREPSTETRT